MPTFEFVLVLKKMSDSALKAALKRSAEYIFEAGGTLRKMENLGQRNLPYKMTANGQGHKVGHFFVFSFDSGMEKPLAVQEKFKLDLDILRSTYWMRYGDPFERHAEEKTECTLEMDLLPPPYRPNVIALQELIEKKKKKKVPKNVEDTDFLIY